MSFKQIRSKIFVVAGILAGLGASLVGNPLDETVNTLNEWVKTERLINQEAAEWETEKAAMENLLAIYRHEVETLSKIIADAEKDTSAAETRRATLLEQDTAVKAVESQALESLGQAERKLKGLEALLPPPLKQELQPLFNSLPQDPDSSKLAIGQRIQPVVAILTQVQKFNQVVTLVEDFREFEAGRTVQTETVYFGLGAAFYVDQANEHAGVGTPGPEGWTWSEDNAMISSIRNFVDIYRGTQQARYVDLPVSLN
ncbi:MAG TPA: DUF3450 family protein [Oceanipulchritudo sp.]|nr:DUF3450 family protein [Oceanipulchritudo sp.]